MGRHSASYIAAQQGHFTGATQAGAAKYVGGVGAVALSLWAGAAIAGSGLANADDTGSTPDNAGPVKTALHQIAGSLRHGLGGDSADGSAGVKLPKPGSLKLSDDGGNALTGPLAGLARRLPHQPASTDAAAKPNSQRGAQPGADLPHVVAPVVSAVTDALRGLGPDLGGTPFGAADRIGATKPAVSLNSFVPSAAPTQFKPASVASAPTAFLTALNIKPLTNTGPSPIAGAPVLVGLLASVRREIATPTLAQPLSLTSIGSLLHPAPLPPANTLNNYPDDKSYSDVDPAADQTATVDGVGEVGKWMLKSDGSVSNYGGQTVDGGKTLVEPVNVIIVDPTSKTPEEATAKLNKAMFLSGFPSQPIHSGGFKALIGSDDQIYGQKPRIPLLAYSDNLFILDNDHGRIFGPAPIAAEDGTGYVWTGAFSSEKLGVSENGIPGHVYVSSNAARDALALRMLASGQVQSIDFVPMNNAIDPGDTDTDDYSSGDHDGYAVVITLK